MCVIGFGGGQIRLTKYCKVFFKLYTLGCKVNQYESEYLREGLRRLGYVELVGGGIADIVFLNTCAVTAESEAKGRKLIRRLIRENRGAEVIVFGCAVRRNAEQFLQIGGITTAATDKEWVTQFLLDKGLRELPTGISKFGERHRAYVKVQDGCRVGCSYCIIPKVRSVLRSRLLDEVLVEVRRLVGNGYSEIVLTGIHLGHYGVDLSGSSSSNLVKLVEGVIGISGDFRVRLSSIEAVEVSAELVELMLNNTGKICPHLHIPMQSGDDEVLFRMRRRWSSGEYISCCKRLLGLFDCLSLTTDVIVGFPGETDEQFARTCEVVRELGFSKVHIFRYSPRQGTDAAKFADKIPQRKIYERVQYLSDIAAGLRSDYASMFVGRSVQVLFETEQTGTTERYLPIKTTKKHNIGKIENIDVKKSQNENLFAD
ncbi:MAG: tRNA (N(6)-L-threonylcarbamoyladenosine(37)-C(2))-methylthiotransferase MtaB [Planctomycetaceae bacterium]|nr:tRNA (N(6)-L-threonylcarbamoyladenosine(37)-C(2))-methylthiotransferase MtaB [Planctomycetaceae bacterium]